MKWLGLEGKSSSTPAPIKAAPVKSTNTNTSTDLPTNTSTTVNTPSVKGGKGGGSRKGSATPKAPSYEAGSIADLEAQYRKLDDELKNTTVSDERLKEILAEKDALTDQIKQLKIRNGLLVEKKEAPKEVKPQAKEGSIAYVQKQI